MTITTNALARIACGAIFLAALAVTGCASTHEHRVDLSQVPARAQAEIGRATAEGRNVEIWKHRDDRGVYYEATFERDGQPHHVAFAEDGGPLKQE